MQPAGSARPQSVNSAAQQSWVLPLCTLQLISPQHNSYFGHKVRAVISSHPANNLFETHQSTVSIKSRPVLFELNAAGRTRELQLSKFPQNSHFSESVFFKAVGNSSDVQWKWKVTMGNIVEIWWTDPLSINNKYSVDIRFSCLNVSFSDAHSSAGSVHDET